MQPNNASRMEFCKKRTNITSTACVLVQNKFSAYTWYVPFRRFKNEEKLVMISGSDVHECAKFTLLCYLHE